MGILRRTSFIISFAAKAAFFCIGISLLNLVFTAQSVSTGITTQEVYASAPLPEQRALREEPIAVDFKEIYSVASIDTAAPALVGDGLHISTIAVNSPVYSLGTNSLGEITVPDYGVGLWSEGTMPGQNGNVFLSGHVFGVFSELKNLPADAIIELAWQDVVYRYQVISNDTYSMASLLADNHILWRDILYSAPNNRNLTIMTCAGSSINDAYQHRTVVRAVQI